MIIVQVNGIDKNVDYRPLFIDIVLGKLEHIIQKRCYLGFTQYRALIFLFRKLNKQLFFRRLYPYLAVFSEKVRRNSIPPYFQAHPQQVFPTDRLQYFPCHQFFLINFSGVTQFYY